MIKRCSSCPKPQDRVGTTGKGVIRAEEEFVGDVVLLSGDQHRVELPRPVVERRDIRVDVRVLPDHDQTFFAERMSDMGEDHAQFWIGDRDLIEKPGTGKPERRRADERRAGVEQDRQATLLAHAIHRRAAFVARIEPGIHWTQLHADQTELADTTLKLLQIARLRWIARSEAEELLGRLGDKGGDIVVGNPDASQPRFHAENHDLVEGCVVRDELIYPDSEVKGKAAGDLRLANGLWGEVQALVPGVSMDILHGFPQVRALTPIGSRCQRARYCCRPTAREQAALTHWGRHRSIEPAKDDAWNG